jgi:isoquinoline 1-oxidoreductase alpha subunit
VADIQLTVNGGQTTAVASPDMPLLWFIRDLLGLTGTKYGCGVGLCGACTLHLDGAAVRACITTAGEAAGRNVTTIEGLTNGGAHPLQEAFIELNVAQCGYCQPGQLMAAAALLDHNPDPSRDDVTAAMRDVLCRCGTYLRIRHAIELAVERSE